MRRSDGERIEAALEDDPDEAVRICEALLDDDEADPDLWAYLAEAQLAAGDGEAALQTLAQVIELDPEWVEASTLRAEILIDLGRDEAAEIELAVAQELDGGDPRVLRARALRAEAAGAFRDADRLYREAAARDPLWPAPPRLDRNGAEAGLRRALHASSVRVAEMPPPGEARLRMVDRGADGAIVVYLRNVERELDDAATADDVVLLVEEALEELEAAG